jgi:single-strand DNA-binding protein
MAIMMTNEIGFVCSDVEDVVTRSGAQIRKFRIGINKSYKQDSEADYFTVTDWTGVSDRIAPSLKRGSRVVVTGRLDFNGYTANTGEARESKDISLLAISFAPFNAPKQQEETW